MPAESTLNPYEEQQERRRERLEERAARRRAEAGRREAAARRVADAIPLGQPILTDHYSAGTDRRRRERMWKNFSRAVELEGEAEELERRAARVGSGGISSDDPDAVEKLEARIAELEASRKDANRINRRWRRAGKPDPVDAEAWEAFASDPKVSDEEVAEARDSLLHQRAAGGGLLSWAKPRGTKNLGANIRRLKRRVEDLKQQDDRFDGVLAQGNGWEAFADSDDNRVGVRFDAKPADEVRSALRRFGLKWSPSRGAWVRLYSGNGFTTVEYSVVRKLRELLG